MYHNILTESPVISSKSGPGDESSDLRELSVLVTGTPTPDVEWRHNDMIIDRMTNDRINISSVPDGEGRRETLTISDIVATDRGQYTLHASNTAGSAKAEWTVHVICKLLQCHNHMCIKYIHVYYVVDLPPLSVGMVEDIEVTSDDSVIRLTCRGQVYSQRMAEVNIQ